MTPPPRRPRDLRHRGVVQAKELWLDAATVDEAGMRRRVLQLWRPGTTVSRGPTGVLVTFAAPVRFDTREAPGLPITVEAGRRTAAPLHARVLAEAPADALLLLRGGVARPLPTAELERVDPSEWIDLGAQRPIGVTALGNPPITAIAVPALAADARSRFGIGSEGTDEVGALVAAMDAARSRGALPASPPGLGARALAGLLGLAGLLAAGPALALRGTRFESLLDRLGRWSARLGFDDAFQRLLGEQNARHLAKMLDLFDRDDLMQALRHAIPLSSVPQDLPPASGGASWLGPRRALEFGPAAETRSAIGLGQELFDHLRRKYRAAHEALDRQGRFKEAAWVLAELLGEAREAVTYLDDRDQLVLAAELAEVKALDPGLVVLLWIRAGNIDRALSLARLRGGWAAALEGLERRGLDVAPAFRLSWAWFEADAGRYVAAADLAWAHPPFRPLARRWLRQAVEVGGTAGARALARLAVVEPGALAEIGEALDVLLADPDPTGVPARRAFAAALGRPADPLGRALLRQAARALLRDAVAAPSAEGRHTARTAAEASGDGALLADLPRLPNDGPEQVPVRQRTTPTPLVVARDDTGTTPILDAVLLPRGRVLLALGEIGARVVDRDGRALVTFATPTHHLVPTLDAGRVLLVGRRGRTLRVTRLDPTRRALGGSFDVEADRFCDAYDGSAWFVAQDGEVVALDAVADSPRALWTSGRLSERRPAILAMRCDPGSLAVAVSFDGEIQRFRYELPGPTLRERRASAVPADLKAVALTPERLLHVCADGLENVAHARVSRLPAPEIRAAASNGTLDAAVSPHEVTLASSDTSTVATARARLVFEGAAQVGARFGGEPGDGVLIAWDELGRLRILGLEDGALRADLRL